MKTNLKTENGITLVALIITIIVLIILAFVTIKGILDHNLIGTTIESIEKYDAQQKEETKMLNHIYDILDNTIKGLGTEEKQTSGLYDANGKMLASWDELENKYGLDIEKRNCR